MEKIMKTKGNLDLSTLEVGETVYEFMGGFGIESKVVTKPVKDGKQWTFKTRSTATGSEIDYMFTEGCAHYGANLYGYKAYEPKQWM